MQFNNSRLVGEIKGRYGTQEEFAYALGIARSTLNLKLKGKLDFTREEINRSCELLGIKKIDIPIYFFEEKV